MQQAEIRLELVKLVYRHGKSPADVTQEAGELEKYVGGPQVEPNSTLGLNRPKGGAGKR